MKIKYEPLVSVITVTYNSSLYVRDTIESVLSQTYTNFEYIIIDDFSTDNTWDIVNEYSDKRIVAIKNEKNLKEYPNRNKALQLAKGEYLIFIDGDDVIYPHGLESFVSYVRLFPDAGLFIQKGYYNNVILPVQLKSEQAIINYYFDDINFMTSSFASNLFSKEVVRKVGGLSNKYITGDEDIRLKIATISPIVLIPGWLTWPRETPGQASSKIPQDVRIREYYYQAIDLINNTTNLSAISCIHNEILFKVRNLAIRYVVRTFLKGKFIKSVRFAKEFKLKFGDLFNNKKSKVQPFFQGFSVNNPLKHIKL